MIVTALIPAAGRGLRLKSAIPKPLVQIGAQPLLIHTLKALFQNQHIQSVIIAAPEDSLKDFKRVIKKNRIAGRRVTLIPGGATRRESVENCLRGVPAESDTILIHDAARPFITQELIAELLKEVKNNPAVICGVPVKATIKQVTSRKSEVKGNVIVSKTLPREGLWEIQTPQVFNKGVLLRAYRRSSDKTVTDDSSLVESLGVKVKIVRGSYFNIKITTPEDLVFAKAILKHRYS